MFIRKATQTFFLHSLHFLSHTSAMFAALASSDSETEQAQVTAETAMRHNGYLLSPDEFFKITVIMENVCNGPDRESHIIELNKCDTFINVRRKLAGIMKVKMYRLNIYAGLKKLKRGIQVQYEHNVWKHNLKHPLNCVLVREYVKEDSYTLQFEVCFGERCAHKFCLEVEDCMTVQKLIEKIDELQLDILDQVTFKLNHDGVNLEGHKLLRDYPLFNLSLVKVQYEDEEEEGEEEEEEEEESSDEEKEESIHVTY
jgi:hypothetical protein